MKIARWLAASSLLMMPGVCTAAPQEPGAEVTAKEWSYQALESLAARGLVHGYKDAKFLDGRKLTRFEMATLVKRVLDTLNELPTPDGKTPIDTAVAGTAASRGQGYEAPATGRPLAVKRAVRTAAFTESDLGTVKRLADSYSVELAVIGVNLQETMDKIEGLEGRVEQLESSLRDPEGPLQTVISNVARIDKVRLTGYLQARYQSFEHTNEATDSVNNTQVVDGFTIRRMRITVNGRPTDKIGMKWQFEGANAALETRDAWVDYFFTGNPATGYTATFGQMKVPFGFEVIQSSSVREHPERSRIARTFFPDERDRGAKIATATGGRWFGEIGVFNTILAGSRGINTNDNNNNKSVAGRIRTSQLGGRLDAGVSFELGNTLRNAIFPGEPAGSVTAGNPRENTKSIFGADFQWFPLDGTVIRGEYMGGKAHGTTITGYVLQLIQNIGKQEQFVARYDWIGADDVAIIQRGAVGGPLGNAPYQGILTNLSLGWIHHLDSSTRLKLFYEINERSRTTVAGAPFQWQGNVLRFEWITLY